MYQMCFLSCTECHLLFWTTTAELDNLAGVSGLCQVDLNLIIPMVDKIDKSDSGEKVGLSCVFIV